MLDFRLIIGVQLLFLCSFLQASNVPFLKTSQIEQLKKENNVVLVGHADFPECQYTKEFIDQMEIAQQTLINLGQDVKVVINNEAGSFDKERGPFSVLYRRGRKDFRIDWLSDGQKLAKWITIKISASPIYQVKSRAQFDYFVQHYSSVFVAYLPNQNGMIEEYKKSADEVNALFILIEDQALAIQVLGHASPQIVAFNNWPEERKTKFPEYATKKDIKEWAENQLNNIIAKLNTQNANTFFTSKTLHLSILFAPQSDSNFTSLIHEFESLHRFSNPVNQGVFTSSFVDTDSSENKPLLDKFGVKYGEKSIVFLPFYANLAQIPFTKQCSNGNETLENLKNQYKGDLMIRSSRWYLSLQGLIN